MKALHLYSDTLFILPSLIGVSIFVLIPFIDVIRRAFLNATAMEFVGLANFYTIFINKAFLLASFNTVKFVGVCIPLLVIISFIVASLLNKGIKGSNVIKSCFLIPMAIPVASVVLLWRVFFDNQGLLNSFLHDFGWKTTDWMNSDAAFYILVISYIWRNLGYNIVLWIAGLSAIPQSLYEAAGVDGAGGWNCFIYITLPHLKATLSTISVLAVLNAFKVFREAYLVSGDYPQQSIYMLQHLFNNWFRDLSLDKLAAAAVVVALVIFVFIMLLQKAWDSKGGEKEN
jgi:multiple sugar transport system permease protein